MEGIFSMEKWRSIAAGMSCLSMLFATGAVTVSASDEITEIPERKDLCWRKSVQHQHLGRNKGGSPDGYGDKSHKIPQPK